MKRRDFFKRTAPLAAAPFVLNAIPYNTFATPSMVAGFGSCDGVDERVLVLIQLEGGNDGINTVVPLEQYATYATLRPNLKLNLTDLHQITDSNLTSADHVGLHPSLTGLKSLYDIGQLNIIQGVGYTDSNQSHFKSTDLWLTGGDGTPSKSNYDTGWMGRYLTNVFPGVAGNPTSFMQDPLGIQLGSKKPSLGFNSHEEQASAINLSGQDPSGFYELVSEIGGVTPENLGNSEYATEMEFIIGVQNSTSTYAQRITQVFNDGTTTGTYPTDYLASQLKTVAKLISGGCKSKIYLCTQFGYDTHNNQIEENDPTSGNHANLMLTLSNAIKAFQDDLNTQGLANKVLTATFSEFGREAPENGSMGTDHGTLAPMFIVGAGLKGGITGTNVNLSNLVQNGTQLTGMQHDYRQVYATILQDWLGASDDTLQAAYFDNYDKLDLIDNNMVVDPSCYSTSSLPIELAYFKASAVNNKTVRLEWETASEHNNDYFEVQRSPDGKSFRSIGRIKSQGESDTLRYYEEYDEEPLIGISYYRLKQVDFNGKTTHSEIAQVEIKNQAADKIKMYPNPVIYDTNLVLNSIETYTAQINIVDNTGRIIKRIPIQVNKGFNKFNIDLQALATGTYHLIFRSEAKSINSVHSFIKQK